jgi:hypothetical protein
MDQVKLKNGLFLLVVLLTIGATMLSAQFYFGRNKVQYATFEWQVLSSEHLQVYFYSEEAEIAQIAIQYGEQFYTELEQKFNHTLARPIPIVVYSNSIHFQQTNILTVLIPESVGGFFEFLKERVAVPFSGQLADFLHALKHEMVHVFYYSKISTVANAVGAWDLPDFPLWFAEGLAEYWSCGWDAQAEMIIRDALLNDYLLPLNSYELYEAGYLLYKEGQAFLRFFEQRYGADRLRELLSEYWRYETFEKALANLTGKKFSDLEEEWRQTLRQQFAPELSQAVLLSQAGEQLTVTGRYSHPTIYQDSSGRRQIICLQNQYGYTDITAIDENLMKSRVLVRGERRADRESLHFPQSGLSINSRGELVYVTKSGGRDVLRVVDIDTKKELNSLEVTALTTIRNPHWSPDGQTVAFAAQDVSGRSDLYLWMLEKNQVWRLTNDIYYDADPCFAPQGHYLAFVSDRDDGTPASGKGLFIYDLQKRQIYRVVGHAYDCRKPIWLAHAPDRIQFIATMNGVANLWEVRIPTNWNECEQVEVSQLTAFYTGLQQAVPVHSDTVIVTALQKYGFQLYRVGLQPPRVVRSDTIRTIRLKPYMPIASQKLVSRRQPYRLKYSFDFAQTVVVQDPIFGFIGGAQVGISDLLGNRYYHFLIANTAQAKGEILDHFNWAVTMVDLTQRCNRTIGLFHFANDYYSPYEGFYYERSQGIRAGMNYPIDVFRRLEFSASLWQAYRDYYFGQIQRATLLSNYVSFVRDNSVWLPTGPLDGWALRLTMGPTFDFRRAKFYNYTFLTDLRLYRRLFASVTWAQRYIAWFNEGTDIYRFYIGGSWGLRGYRLTEVYGCKYFMINQELRFPFAQSLMLRFGQLDLRLAPIRGALFCDVGNAWDDEYPGVIGSFGVGLRAVLLGNLVLRLDTGRKTDFHSINKHQFWQFFFGYDF